MSDMRTFLDLVSGSTPSSRPSEVSDGPFAFLRSLMEGDVVSLGAEKSRRDSEKFHAALDTYVDSINSISAGMKAKYDAHGGKFAYLLRDLMDGRGPGPFGKAKDVRLSFGMLITFRDFKLKPEAREALNNLKKQRAEINFTKFHKDFKGVKNGPKCFLELTPRQAAEIFAARETPAILARYGAYQPSALGHGTATYGGESYTDAGVGFQIYLSNYFDSHAIDDDEDMKQALEAYQDWVTWKDAPKPAPKPKMVSSNDAPQPAPVPEKPKGPQGEFDFGAPQPKKPSLRVVR